MRTARRFVTRAVGIVLVLQGCAPPPPPAVDSGADASHVGDAAIDSAIDASDAADLRDAGDAAPRPPGPPTFVYRDETVRCEAPARLEMAPLASPRPEPGTVLWTYRPSIDPEAEESLRNIGAIGVAFQAIRFAGTASGGLVALFNRGSDLLGVTSDGRFGFASVGGAADGAPMWLMSGHVVARTASDTVFGGGVPLLDIHHVESGTRTSVHAGRPTFAASLPGDPRSVDDTGSALLRDGTVVWTPTHRTLMAVCPDGRIRWVVEHDGMVGIPRLFGDGDGNVVLAGATTYRFDPDGNLLAMRAATSGYVLGYSDSCGVAYQQADGTRVSVRYLSGSDFSAERSIPNAVLSTSDCGAWGSGTAPSSLRRIRPDRTTAFEYVPARLPAGSVALGTAGPIELADGSWLLANRGGPIPPSITIVDDTGHVRLDRVFDPNVVGEEITPDAYLVTPHGVLYFASSSSFFAVQQLVAVDLGVGVPTESSDRLITWANDAATWR